MKLKLLLILFATVIVPVAGQRPDAVIFPKPTPTRLAVADFVPRTSANQETKTALTVFNRVLVDDLRFSAFFEIPSKSFYPLKPIRTPQDVVFENWQVPTLDADFLAFGSLQVDSTVTVVEAYLYDVKTQQQILGKRYTIADAALIRRVAHEFADQIVYELSAGSSRGVATSQIAYSSLKEGNKEIWTMDYDGSGPRQLSFHGGIAKFPEWSADNSRLIYVVKPPTVNGWELRMHELEGSSTTIPVQGNYVSSPDFSRDGRIAFSARSQRSSDSDIFVMSLSDRRPRNITNHRGIDTSPSWSPTGSQIAFISDRSGSPQVWVMDSDGSNVRRLIQEGGHCDSPDWSPDGRFILYSWQAPTQWKHDVYLAEVATGKLYQLTSGFGSNESPHWSPDGRHIAFQSTKTGTKQIFVMNADGKNLKQVTTYGINESPSWGNYAPEME